VATSLRFLPRNGHPIPAIFHQVFDPEAPLFPLRDPRPEPAMHLTGKVLSPKFLREGGTRRGALDRS
jgi:hypothetical protein